jgi:hypothetical protein
MNRRDSLKAIGLTALSTTVLIEACKQPGANTETSAEDNAKEAGREQWETDRDKKLKSETFFTKHEMATITVLTGCFLLWFSSSIITVNGVVIY